MPSLFIRMYAGAELARHGHCCNSSQIIAFHSGMDNPILPTSANWRFGPRQAE